MFIVKWSKIKSRNFTQYVHIYVFKIPQHYKYKHLAEWAYKIHPHNISSQWYRKGRHKMLKRYWIQIDFWFKYIKLSVNRYCPCCLNCSSHRKIKVVDLIYEVGIVIIKKLEKDNACKRNIL